MGKSILPKFCRRIAEVAEESVAATELQGLDKQDDRREVFME
jgi:hypothetical protein